MKDNKLAGLEEIKNNIAQIKVSMEAAMMQLECVEKEIDIMVGDPLKLSYGHSETYGNCEGSRTEIKMSRECTLGELRWVLTHMYGVDETRISVKGSRIGGVSSDTRVRVVYMDDTWGRVEYTIVLCESK